MFPFGKNLYPLRQELRHEIERLKNILAAHGKEFVTNQGVSKTRLRKTEQKLGYQLDPDLAAFYALTDGSPARDKWFAVGVQNPVPVALSCFDDSLKGWQTAVEREGEDREYWERVEQLGNLSRDPRIAPAVMFGPRWWGFAKNDWETTVMLDMEPSPSGKLGQVIVYYHDPDALICVADNFLEFFRKSNDFLEICWDKIFSDEV